MRLGFSMRPASVFAKGRDGAEGELEGWLFGPGRRYMRGLMVLKSAQGMAAEEIAGLLACDSDTVRKWVYRFDQEGIAGLGDRPRSGRPPVGGDGLADRIAELLLQPMAWTAARVAAALELKVSPGTMRRRLLGVARFGRPKQQAKGDPLRPQVIAEIKRKVAALGPRAVLLAADETHIDWLCCLRCTWQLIGHRMLVPTPGVNRRKSIFGALDCASGNFVWSAFDNANADAFVAFLEQITNTYAQAAMVAIYCDNAGIHGAKLVNDWLAHHPQVELIFGPRYSPQDNPTERIWAALKRSIANTWAESLEARLAQAQTFFSARSAAQMLATATPASLAWMPEGYPTNLRIAA